MIYYCKDRCDFSQSQEISRECGDKESPDEPEDPGIQQDPPHELDQKYHHITISHDAELYNLEGY